jgi:hypothetical protein
MEIPECQICSYKQKCEFVLKHFEIDIYYNLCENCNFTFQTGLRKNLTNLALELGVEIPCDKKGWKKIFVSICKHFNDETNILEKISSVIVDTFNICSQEIKYFKPFNQCKIYSHDGKFHGFTTYKKMQQALKYVRAVKISDNEIKWIQPVEEKTSDKYYFNYSRNKDNECIKCGSSEYLTTITILPKMPICEYEGEGINIHFYYGVCSKCRADCENKIVKCAEIFLQENNKDICSFINGLISDKKKEDLSNVIEDYNVSFKKMIHRE